MQSSFPSQSLEITKSYIIRTDFDGTIFYYSGDPIDPWTTLLLHSKPFDTLEEAEQALPTLPRVRVFVIEVVYTKGAHTELTTKITINPYAN